MDNHECPRTPRLEDNLPPILENIMSNSVAGFDSVEMSGGLAPSPTFSRSPDIAEVKNKADSSQTDIITIKKNSGSISISIPSTPSGVKRVMFSEEIGAGNSGGIPRSPSMSIFSNNEQRKQRAFHSQSIPTGHSYNEAATKGKSNSSELEQRYPRNDRLRDKRFDSFKTKRWSGRLERQISNLIGKQQEPEPKANVSQKSGDIKVGRYFDALEGPELDTLRDSEELVLPKDKLWPFLLRYPISSFGVGLGVSSQAILWKTLASSKSTSFLHIPLKVNLVLWCIAIVLIAIITCIYSLKIIFYFEAVRREYYHPIRVNFFFAPWISFLFLALGLPPSVGKTLHPAIWYVLMTPIFCLELKIYGQWMSGGQRRLSKVANPSNHLSIVGNFVGALLGASMGLREGPIFFFAIGMAHYTVLFVTLYQRLPTNETLPKELHPVFFLFVAAPSVASMAWANIQGSFDYGSRISYFIALFLYFSLAVRVNFFRGFRFSIAWWAYTFPMTGAAIATIRYSNQVTNPVTQALCVILSAISTLTVMALLVSTILHAFVKRDLFPNDISIAIAQKTPKMHKKRFHLRSSNTDAKDNEHSLKPANSDVQMIEIAVSNGPDISGSSSVFPQFVKSFL